MREIYKLSMGAKKKKKECIEGGTRRANDGSQGRGEGVAANPRVYRFFTLRRGTLESE